MGKIKKIILTMTSFILCFFIIVTPTFGKYTKSEKGTLCDLIFGSYSMVSNIFEIISQDKSESETLWPEEGGSTSLHSLNDKAFYIKNTSGKRMIISLVIDFDIGKGNEKSKFVVSGYRLGKEKKYTTTLVNGTPSTIGEAQFTVGQAIKDPFIGIATIGYKCHAEVNANQMSYTPDGGEKRALTQEEKEETFVINDDQTIALNFGIVYDESINLEWVSKYVSVKLVATPYE